MAGPGLAAATRQAGRQAGRLPFLGTRAGTARLQLWGGGGAACVGLGVGAPHLRLPPRLRPARCRLPLLPPAHHQYSAPK